MLRADAVTRRDRWARALEQIARDVGKGEPLYHILGTIAWGRYDGEPSGADTKDNVIFGLGFLQGVRFAAHNAASHLGLKGERALATIHEQIRILGKTPPR